MATLTIQEASRRSGLSEPTLRYYEQVGLIGPIPRDTSSRHRRYRDEDLDTLQALACLRSMGVGIEDMRTYQANRARGQYLREKAALWDARDRGDAEAEAEAGRRVQAMLPRLEEVLR